MKSKDLLTPNNLYDYDDEITRMIQEREDAPDDKLAGPQKTHGPRRNPAGRPLSRQTVNTLVGSAARPLRIRAKRAQVRR